MTSRPTQHVGNSAFVQSRIVRTGPCRMSALMGTNNSGVTKYLMVFEKAAVPANGSSADLSFPCDAGRAYAFAMPDQVDLDACTAVWSDTSDTLTLSAGTPGSIQALLKV